jgi:uncharacterized protein (UPF0333 family)
LGFSIDSNIYIRCIITLKVRIYEKTQKQKTQKNNSKKALLIVATVVLLALGGAGYHKFINDDSASVSQAEQDAAAQAEVDEAKQRAEEADNNGENPLKDVDDSDTTTPSIPNDSVSLSEPTYSQTNRMINSSVLVGGANTGSCKFTFVDADGRPVVRSAPVSNGNCSVSISEAEFTLLGTWTLNVEFAGKSVTRKVEVT